MTTPKMLLYLLIIRPGTSFPRPGRTCTAPRTARTSCRAARSSCTCRDRLWGNRSKFEFFDSWYPVAVWICTRKRDGAAAEVCRFDALDDDEDSINGYGSGPYGNITFYNKQLNLPREMEGLSAQGWEVMEYFDEVHSGATLCFDTWSLRRWSLT